MYAHCVPEPEGLFVDGVSGYSTAVPATYILEVQDWLPPGSPGLPVGIHYTLQVSVDFHAINGFLFGPQTLAQGQNNSTPGTAQLLDGNPPVPSGTISPFLFRSFRTPFSQKRSATTQRLVIGMCMHRHERRHVGHRLHALFVRTPGASGYDSRSQGTRVAPAC